MNKVSEIVNNGLCIGCGICAYSENIGTSYCQKRDQFIPSLANENSYDKIAFEICPGKGYNIVSDSNALFTAEYDVQLGHVFSTYASYSKEKEILKKASSGGLMSHIAIYLLENGIVNKVLVTSIAYESEPRATGFLASSKEEILSAQGSKYCPVNLSAAVREIKNTDCKVAVIGTPCQIAGIRAIQKFDACFGKKIVIAIANFCGGVKSYKNVRLIAQRSGINPQKIRFLRFRGGGQPGSMRLEEKDGMSVELPYPKYVGLNGLPKHLRCHLCVDATGELADIACGDAWLPRFLQDANPWSIVLTRNLNADTIVKDMFEKDLINLESISIEDVKQSQRQNLTSKKIRQKSRFYLYRKLGYKTPSFDGGYFDNAIKLSTEIKVFTKHYLKNLMEKLHIFYYVYRKTKM